MQTIFAISPNLGRGTFLSAPVWVQNNPKTITASFTGVNVAERFFNIAPCLFALSQQGVQVQNISRPIDITLLLSTFLKVKFRRSNANILKGRALAFYAVQLQLSTDRCK